MLNPVTKKSLPKDSIDSTEENLIRVLHVDDEAGLLKGAKEILEMQGSFQVETALSVNEALEKMKKKAFDVIVSDYVMPERNGLDFLRELREGGNGIPFILFTGKGREEVAIRALNLGADRYFNKIGHPEAVYGELAYGIRQAVDRKRAEETLKKSEEKYRSIVDLSPDGIATMNMKGTVTSVNKAFLDLTGFSKDEIVGKHFTKLGTIRARDLPKYVKLISSIFRGKTLENIEFAYVRKDGTQRLGEARISLMKEKGKNMGLQAILRDITERKQMEEHLRESEEKYRKQFEGALDAIFLADAETGILLDCNRAATELVGREKSEIIGKHQNILHPPEEIDGKFSRTYKLHLKKKAGQVLEAQVITKTGAIKDVEIKANVFELGGKKVMHGAFRDVTERKRVERAFQASEEKYRQVVEQAPDSIMTFDVNGVVTSRNKAAVAMGGISNEDVIGKHFSELKSLSEGNIQKFLKLQKSLIKGKVPKPFEIVYHRKDETPAYGEVHISLMKEGDRITGFQAIMRDITERKKTEKALRQKQELLEIVTANIGAGLAIISKDFQVLWVNNVVEEYRKKYADGKMAGFCYHVFGRRNSICPGCGVKEIFETGKSSTVHQQPVPYPNGQILWLEFIATPIKDENGNIIAALEVFYIINERKKAEAALRESEERYRTLFESTREGIVISGPDDKILTVNPAALAILGYKSLEELVGIPAVELYFDAKARKVLFEKMKEKGYVDNYEMLFKKKDGSTIYVVCSAILRKDKEGNILKKEAFFRDITEQKKAEQLLKESEANYREIINGMNDTVWVIGLDGKNIDVNDAAVEVLGYSREELLSMGPQDFDSTVTAEQINGFVEQLKTVGKTLMETVHTTKDGKRIPVEISSSLVTYQGKQAVLSIARDITERKLAEKALQESKGKWRSITEYSPDHIMLLDRDANILYINRPLPDLTSEEIIGKSVYQHILPEFHEAAAICIESVLETGKPNSYYVEYRTRNGEIRYFQVRIGPIFHSGKVVALISSSTDITERQIAWESLEETMNELAATNEKLGVVGKLTRHDARNKLSVITNNLYLVKQKLADNPDGLEYLGDIESAIGQIEQIFDFARTYEMLGMEELSYINVETSVKEAAMLFSELADVTFINGCSGLTVLADSMLRQLFYNLMDDTMKHGENVSQIKVYYKEGINQLKLVYEDDGVGIPEDEKELIFKEGYGKGTGYGLYLIKKMCEAYGWIIQETGKQGKGAQFTITIPKMGRSGKINYTIN